MKTKAIQGIFQTPCRTCKDPILMFFDQEDHKWVPLDLPGPRQKQLGKHWCAGYSNVSDSPGPQ